MYGSGDTTTLPSNEIELTASDYDGDLGRRFGSWVSAGSGRIVVGAREDQEAGINAGAAYIFDLEGNEITKITASDAINSHYFGDNHAVGNGRIVVGAYNDNDNGSQSGAAYIFDLNGNELTKITASDGAAGDHFGHSTGVGSGRIVVGAYRDDSYTGSAYIFDLDGNELKKITAPDGVDYDNFAKSLAVGNGRIVVGAYRDDDDGSSSGSAYIYDIDGNFITKITASDGAAEDFFGYSVAVGCGRIVVGASGDDKDVGPPNSGSAYIYDLDGNFITKITASDGKGKLYAGDQFGYSVAVASGRIVVSAYGDDDYTGSAYIFDLDGNELFKISGTNTGQRLAYNVAAANGKIVIGSYYYAISFIYDTPNVITPYDVKDWEYGY
jgi:hypothetical protein